MRQREGASYSPVLMTDRRTRRTWVCALAVRPIRRRQGRFRRDISHGWTADPLGRPHAGWVEPLPQGCFLQGGILLALEVAQVCVARLQRQGGGERGTGGGGIFERRRLVLDPDGIGHTASG